MNRHKGFVCGILAAVCYGTNPLGALPLYSEGVNTTSVLFYRFFIAVIILFFVLFAKRQSFRVTWQELKVLSLLGFVCMMSCFTYYQSFRYMDAGIASTILFVYPVFVALIMMLFFKERLKLTSVISIALAMLGICLLYKGGDGKPLSTVGIVLVFLSSIMYAMYIVVINKVKIKMSSSKMTFYILTVCAFLLFLYSHTSQDVRLQFPPSPRAWLCAFWLGLVPTVLSFVLMTISVREIGATPTAIIGALEPLSAVAIGVLVFDEYLSLRLVFGILFILLSVMIVVLGGKISAEGHLFFSFCRRLFFR